MNNRVIKTKTLATHSIQKNMVASEISGNVVVVLLATNYLMKIVCPSEGGAENVYNRLNFAPSESGSNWGVDNNSTRFTFEMTIQLFEN